MLAQARSAASYKEEVYRFLHDQPNGVIADDRVGIVRVIAAAFEYALPISVGTVSSALGTLEREGRIVLERGHRSEGNRLLFTRATVCSEPLVGRAIGPSDPVERQPLRLVEDELDVLGRLRRIENSLANRSVPMRVDVEKVHEHVLCLVEDNERLTGEIALWEELAIEADSRLSDALSRQRESLVQEHEDETQSLRVQLSDAQDALITTSRSVEARLSKADHEYSAIRDRGEKYRQERDVAKAHAVELEAELLVLREANKDTDAAIAGLKERLEIQHRHQLAANRERDEAMSAREQTRSIAIAREKEILYEFAKALHVIRQLTNVLVENVRRGKVTEVANFCGLLGLDDDRIDLEDSVIEKTLGALLEENGMVALRSPRSTPNNTPVLLKAARASLNADHGKL